MVEWFPIWKSALNAGSLASGSALVSGIPLEEHVSGDQLPPGTIVNGWLNVDLFTPDGTALTAGRGPVQAFLLILPPNSSPPAATAFQTEDELKGWDDSAWVMGSTWFDGMTTAALHFRFNLTTLRKYARGATVYLVINNETGAAFAANADLTIFGEFYIQED